MRVLFLTPGFAAHEHDLNCIPPLQLLARALIRQGVDLHIIALEYPFRGAPYCWGGVCEAGVYPCNGRNRRYLRWRTLARARAFAKQLFTEKRFDVIHSFWLGPAWVLGEQLAARWQTPHFTTLMGQDVLPANRYLRRLRAEGASRLVALTSFHNDVLEKTTGLRAAHCIPWGVAKSDIPASLPAERPVDVLGVGSLVPVKNWEQWLRVLHLAAAARPGLSALLLGAGPEESRLRVLANRLHLSNNIQFAGEIPRPEVLACMRESRVLLHTARFESFGMVLAEAAAQGCRVVGTPVGIAPALGICADADTTLATLLLQALEAPVLTGAPILITIEDTAEGYLRLWAGVTSR